jgi:hypothetical protein
MTFGGFYQSFSVAVSYTTMGHKTSPGLKHWSSGVNGFRIADLGFIRFGILDCGFWILSA